jgi:hypothetical protein
LSSTGASFGRHGSGSFRGENWALVKPGPTSLGVSSAAATWSGVTVSVADVDGDVVAEEVGGAGVELTTGGELAAGLFEPLEQPVTANDVTATRPVTVRAHLIIECGPFSRPFATEAARDTGRRAHRHRSGEGVC